MLAFSDVGVSGPQNKVPLIFGNSHLSAELAGIQGTLTLRIIWVVIKIRVPFWVPYILGAVL